MYNPERTPLSRELIVNTAFDVWGSENYRNTSLSSLSRKLSITKQAIYRHFNSKQDLFDAMESETLRIMEESANFFSTELKGKNVSEGLKLLAGHIAHKNKSNETGNDLYQHQVNFSTFVIRQNRSKSKLYQEKIKKMITSSAEALGLPYVALEFALNLFFYFSVILEDLPLEEMIDYIINGFTENLDADSSHYQNIFREAQKLDVGIVSAEDDKISRAVFETILKEGFENVSLHSIAQAAGMKKSSLYNYYDSKDDMLQQVMGKYIKHTMSLHNDFVEKHDDLGEILFAHYSFIYRIFSFKPKGIDVLFELFVSGENIIKFLQNEGMETMGLFNTSFLKKIELNLTGKIRKEVEDRLTMVNLVFIYNVVISTSIRMSIVLEKDENFIIENAGAMVRLFLRGISLYKDD